MPKIFVESKKMAAFLKYPRLHRALWFMARLMVFLAIWTFFLGESYHYYFHHVDDIGAPFLLIGLAWASPLVFLLWLVIDIIYSRKGLSQKNLWILLGVIIAGQIFLSPIWQRVGLVMMHWITILFFK